MIDDPGKALREALEKHCHDKGLDWPLAYQVASDGFWAGAAATFALISSLAIEAKGHIMLAPGFWEVCWTISSDGGRRELLDIKPKRTETP